MKTAEPYDEVKGRFLTKKVEEMSEILAALQENIGTPEDLEQILSNTFFILHNFKIWKTIKIIGGQDLEKMKRKMKKAKIETVSLVYDVLKGAVFSKKESKSNIVLLSIEDLGFSFFKEVTYEDICLRAKRLGLSLCSMEMALQLRLQYLDQPEDEWIAIATSPIIVSNEQKLFVLGRNKCGLWLNCITYCAIDDFWYRRKFAFIANGLS